MNPEEGLDHEMVKENVDANRSKEEIDRFMDEIFMSDEDWEECDAFVTFEDSRLQFATNDGQLLQAEEFIVDQAKIQTTDNLPIDKQLPKEPVSRKRRIIVDKGEEDITSENISVQLNWFDWRGW